MESMTELTEYVALKAKAYLNETGESVETFPTSIVDFVIEYAAAGCHFPTHFKESDIVSTLESGKNAIAMACVDVYSKVGAEGQITHSENSVSRSYKSAWITFDLLSNFPNYVRFVTN